MCFDIGDPPQFYDRRLHTEGVLVDASMGGNGNHEEEKVNMSNKEQPEDYVFDFESVFDADNYLYFYEDVHMNEKETAEEVNFLVKELHLDKSMRILDLACGQGRHSLRLAELGHTVVGVDTNEGLLSAAEKRKAGRDLSVQFLRQDMRTAFSLTAFDRVLLLFTSFGYFGEKENLLVLKRIASALKPEGLCCLDVPNRDSLVRNLPPYSVIEKAGDLMIDRHHFDALTGRLLNKRIYIRDGRRTDAPFSLRLYCYTELRDLLEIAGLRIQALYGDWDGRPFATGSGRLIVVAGKVAMQTAG